MAKLRQGWKVELTSSGQRNTKTYANCCAACVFKAIRYMYMVYLRVNLQIKNDQKLENIIEHFDEEMLLLETEKI